MKYRITISGFSGQNVLFTGKILSRAAQFGGHKALWMPSLISEMRGDSASCRLIIEKEQNTAATDENILIALNKCALKQFEDEVNSLIITDDHLGEYCKKPTICLNTDICSAGGEFEGLTDIVLLGAMIEETGIVDRGDVYRAIHEVADGGKIKRICRAMEYGRQKECRRARRQAQECMG